MYKGGCLEGRVMRVMACAIVLEQGGDPSKCRRFPDSLPTSPCPVRGGKKSSMGGGHPICPWDGKQTLGGKDSYIYRTRNYLLGTRPIRKMRYFHNGAQSTLSVYSLKRERWLTEKWNPAALRPVFLQRPADPRPGEAKIKQH